MGLKLVLRAQPHPQFLKWYKTFSYLFGSHDNVILPASTTLISFFFQTGFKDLMLGLHFETEDTSNDY